MLYKGDKDVNAAARSPESGSAEVGGILASSLPRHDHLNLGERRVEEGRTRAEARALLVFTGHRSTVQCGPDEPDWSWIQIWVQARMPDYSLNWTARTSAIQRWQRCQRCSSPTRRRPIYIYIYIYIYISDNIPHINLFNPWYWCSTRKALALYNPRRLICH